MAAQQQIVDHGRAFEQLDVLERARDAGAGDTMARQRGNVAIAQRDAARARLEHAGDDVEHRGLARAVRPDDREHLALLDRKAEIADRGQPAKPQRQVSRPRR